VVPIGLTLLTAATLWMTTLAPTTPSWQIALTLAIRGFGMGFSFMPSISAAFVTLAPTRIARATSISNVGVIGMTKLDDRGRPYRRLVAGLAGGSPRGVVASLQPVHPPEQAGDPLEEPHLNGFRTLIAGRDNTRRDPQKAR
jgi:hypothetical protein